VRELAGEGLRVSRVQDVSVTEEERVIGKVGWWCTDGGGGSSREGRRGGAGATPGMEGQQ
jgi:hypothetical protein